MRSTEPKCVSSARRLAGPTPRRWSSKRVAGLGRSTLPVIADGEPVSLVPEPLEELKPGRRAFEDYRPPLPGNEDELLPLGEGDDGDPRQLVLVHRLERGRQLTLTRRRRRRDSGCR